MEVSHVAPPDGAVAEVDSRRCTIDWDIQALPDITFQYRGPTAEEANVCTCSSVAYMLSSACGWCQGDGYPE